MKATRVRDLLVIAALFAVAGYLATRGWYLVLPPLTWVPGGTLTLLALIELAVAARVHAVIGHKADVRPLPAIVIARFVALGRGSAAAGAIFTGLAVGFSAYVIGELSSIGAGAGELLSGAVLTVGSVLLCVAGLVLERSGIAPPPAE